MPCWTSSGQDHAPVRSVENGAKMPLKVTSPGSPVIATWRAPLWQRVVFPAFGIPLLIGSLWPDPVTAWEPFWLGVAVALWLIAYPLRPRLTLHEVSTALEN